MFSAKKLKEMREKKGLTESEVSGELYKVGEKVDRKTIQNYEKGVTEPKASTLFALGKIYHVKISEFFTNEKK